MWYLFDILHHLNFFLVAAMMLFATIFNHDLGKDTKYAPLLLVLIPLWLCLLQITAFIYINKIPTLNGAAGTASLFSNEESLTFFVYFSSFFMNTVICLFILGALRFIIILFEFKDRSEKLFSWLAVFYVIAVFVINMVYLFSKAMEDPQGLTSWASWGILTIDSGVMFIPAVFGLFRLSGMKKKEKDAAKAGSGGENLRNRKYIRCLTFSFLPMPVFLLFDVFGIDRGMILETFVPFRTTFIPYTVFVIWCLYHLMQDKVEHTRPIISAQDQRAALKEFGVSEREIDIIEVVAQGNPNKDIAEALFISENTVKSHIKNIYRKLEISNRIQLLKLLEKLRTHR